MLVLTRCVDEWIEIGPEIRVMVTLVEGDRVRLGIEAPTTLNVRRSRPSERWRPRDKAGERSRAGE